MKQLPQLLILALVLSAFAARAQNATISGRMLDPNGVEPLIGVNVLLLRAADSTQISGAATDVDGNFQIEDIPAGNYLLKATYIGYETLDTTVYLNNENLNLGTIRLQLASRQLQSVQVDAVQIRAQQKGDTTEFNAGAYKVNPDATTEQLVQKMPGVTVENGVVKTQGEDVKRVTIDGKEFFGDDATLALRNLPAEIVDKIQVFDRLNDQAQFTGFNDGNTEKALNIVTRGGMGKIEFGRLSAGYGTDDRYAAGGNYNIFNGDARISIVGLANNVNQQNFSSQDLLGVSSGDNNNQRGGGGRPGGPPGGGRGNFGGGGGASNFLIGQQGGINSTNSFGVNYSDSWGKKFKITSSYFFNNSYNETSRLSARETFLQEGGSIFYNENSDSKSDNYNHRVNFRMEYTIDSSNSIIITPRLSFQNNNANSLLFGSNGSDEGSLLSRTRNDRESDNSGYNFNNEILWRHRFGKQGRTFSINLNTSLNDRVGKIDQYSLTEYFAPDSTELRDQITDTASDGYTLSTNLNYTEPIGKAAQLQFTYSPSFSQSNSERITNQLNEATNAYTELDPVLSNRFDNETTTQRGGLSYRLRVKNINFNVGADYQNIGLSSAQSFPRTLNVDKSFDNILPSVRIEYRPAQGMNFNLFYRTQTQTPSVTQLQNVIDNSNPLQLSAGNPNLSQQYTNTLVMRYNRTNIQTASTFFAVVSANFTSDYITNSTFIASKDTLLQEGVTLNRGSQLSQPVNLDGFWTLRSFLTYGMPVKLIKSNLNVNAGFTYTLSPGLINNALNEANTYNINGGLVLSSNISESLDFNISYSANYNIVKNTLQPQLDNNYYYQNTSLRFNWLPWKSVVINTDLTHSLYTGLGDEFNQSFLLWNAGVGYKFLKNKVGEVRLNAFDLLKQNNSIMRNVTETYVEDVRTDVLTRYFMLTFTYNIRNLAGAANRSGGTPPNPGMPGFPRQ